MQIYPSHPKFNKANRQSPRTIKTNVNYYVVPTFFPLNRSFLVKINKSIILQASSRGEITKWDMSIRFADLSKKNKERKLTEWIPSRVQFYSSRDSNRRKLQGHVTGGNWNNFEWLGWLIWVPKFRAYGACSLRPLSNSKSPPISALQSNGNYHSGPIKKPEFPKARA